MCLAVPMKILSIENSTAVAEQSGCTREVRIDFIPDVSVGDFILVHAGMAIEKVREEEAEETLRMIRMVTDEIY